MQTQDCKNFFCPKEYKSKDLKSILSYNNIAKLPKKKNKKDKKKKIQGQK